MVRREMKSDYKGAVNRELSYTHDMIVFDLYEFNWILHLHKYRTELLIPGVRGQRIMLIMVIRFRAGGKSHVYTRL